MCILNLVMLKEKRGHELSEVVLPCGLSMKYSQLYEETDRNDFSEK